MNLFKTVNILSGMLLFTVLASSSSCQSTISSINGVEVGDIPQKVKDIYIGLPENVKVEVWQQNLEIPWSLVFFPDGDALVSERPGRIRFISNGDLKKEPYAILENVDHSYGSEKGLMGLALHPDFENEPYVYVMYTHRHAGTFDNRVIRLKHLGTTGELDREIVTGIPAGSNHNGGRIKFGPDGMLYILTGEKFDRDLAQSTKSLGGKILRVTPEGDIPPGNPFEGSIIYTLGHRNPQGIDWHPETGDPFSSEHGPSGEMMLTGRDIINVIYPGKNYGWPKVVGKVNKEEYEDPVIMWENTTPPGGLAFRDNALFVSTLRSEALIRVTMDHHDDNYEIRSIERWFSSSRNRGTYGRLRDVVAGPDGALYVLTSNRDGRGNPAENDDRILRIIFE